MGREQFSYRHSGRDALRTAAGTAALQTYFFRLRMASLASLALLGASAKQGRFLGDTVAFGMTKLKLPSNGARAIYPPPGGRAPRRTAGETPALLSSSPSGRVTSCLDEYLSRGAFGLGPPFFCEVRAYRS